MTTKLRMSTAAAALLITAISASATVRAEENESELSISALSSAKVTLSQAIAAAEAKSGGKAYDAALKTDDGAPVYLVEVFSSDKVVKVAVDTQSGEVKKVETMSEDYDGDGDGQ